MTNTVCLSVCLSLCLSIPSLHLYRLDKVLFQQAKLSTFFFSGAAVGCSSPAERAMTDGRIGPSQVSWDNWAKFGKCMIDPATGRFYSTTNFSSVRANTCVCKGE